MSGDRSAASRTRCLPARRLLLAGGLLLGVLASAGAPPSAHGDQLSDGGSRAGEAPRGVTRLADIGFGDVRARGQLPVQEFFFPGPGDFALGANSRLVLVLSHSNLLHPADSTVNVVMNGRPLRAIRLDEHNIDPRSYEVRLPPDVLASDFNRLSLEYRMSITRECGDPLHPALFATVHPDTRLELDFASDPPLAVLAEPNLADYPYPFFRGGFPVVAPVTIVVPNEPSAVELTTAYRLAADLAGRVFFDLDLLDVRQVRALDAAARREHQLVLIGTPDRHPLLARALAGSTFRVADGALARVDDHGLATSLAPDHGVLVVGPSPWNAAFRALLVTGVTDEAVVRAVDAITSPEPSALFAGPQAVLTKAVAVPRGAREFRSAFTFGDTGEADTTIVGDGGTHDVLFSAPALAPDSTVQLDLVVSTPEVLDRRRSNIVLELNGQNVQTIELSATESHRASYRVTLPSDLFRVGPNTLRMRTTLYTSDASSIVGPCTSAALERLWATIHADSAIALPETGELSTGADLASLPFPFAGLYGIEDAVFIVDAGRPASLRGGMLATIALGRRANTRPDFEVQLAPSATQATIGDRHVIAIGLPDSAPLRAEVDRALPLLLQVDGSRALVGADDVLTEILDSARLGAIQEASVPWAETRRLLALDGTDDEALTWVARALTERTFDGTVALLQSPTVVRTFALERAIGTAVEQELEDRFTEEVARERTMAAFALIGTGAVLLLVVWALRGVLPFRG